MRSESNSISTPPQILSRSADGGCVLPLVDIKEENDG